MSSLLDPLAEGFQHQGTNGEAVVLTHGFTGVPAHFRPLASVLNDAGYTVIVPRLAGHGTSQDDMATTGATDWIASARAAYDEVAGDHHAVHLGGLSMGGLISILLASELDVASVTTINSPVIVYELKSYIAPLLTRWIPTVEWEDTGTPDLDEEMRQYWITYDGFPTAKLGDLYTIALKAVLAARSVRTPALVIQSRTDETVRPISARILANSLRGNSRLVWLERSMHNALLDREREVIASTVLTHLEESS